MRTEEGVSHAVTAGANSMIKAIKAKDFHKYLAVANPKNGEAFFEEVIISLFLNFVKFRIISIQLSLFFLTLFSLV